MHSQNQAGGWGAQLESRQSLGILGSVHECHTEADVGGNTSLSMVVTTKAKVGGMPESKLFGVWGIFVCKSTMANHVMRRQSQIIRMSLERANG